MEVNDDTLRHARSLMLEDEVRTNGDTARGGRPLVPAAADAEAVDVLSTNATVQAIAQIQHRRVNEVRHQGKSWRPPPKVQQ